MDIAFCKSPHSAGNAITLVLLNTATQDFVLVDDGNEIFEVFTSNVLANGAAPPTLITGQSQKTFPKGAQALD
jgi:hypothetical protein